MTTPHSAGCPKGPQSSLANRLTKVFRTAEQAKCEDTYDILIKSIETQLNRGITEPRYQEYYRIGIIKDKIEGYTCATKLINQQGLGKIKAHAYLEDIDANHQYIFVDVKLEGVSKGF